MPGAVLPHKASEEAAGFDLYNAEDITVAARGQALVETGIAIRLPKGCYGRIASRSGLAHQNSIHVGAGVIDPDYRGTLKVILFNLGDKDFAAKAGSRVAQLICEKILQPTVELAEQLEPTQRGDSGLGSTGEMSARTIGVMAPLALTQQEDKNIKKIYKLVQSPSIDKEFVTTAEDSAETKRLAKMIEHLHIREDGILMATLPLNVCRRTTMICPSIPRKEIITEKHKTAHLGIEKTAARIRLEWYWPGLYADVRRHVTSCQSCQQSKVTRSKPAEQQYHLYAGRP